MIRNAEEANLPSIRGLIQSVSGLWHEERRSGALEQACRATSGLAFIWEEDKKSSAPAALMMSVFSLI